MPFATTLSAGPFLQTLVAAFVGAAVFEAMRVPAGALIGGLVAVAALNLWSDTARVVELPSSLRFAAFALLGWAIGQGVTPETLQTLRDRLVPMVLIVGALLVFGALVALLLTRLGILDGTTAFLAASPGALSQMSALGTALQADATLVAAVHTMRVVTLVLLTPIVARLVASG